MPLNQADISARDKFRPEGLEPEERSIIAGALNRYGVENPYFADANTLTAFTWEQVLHALQQSRRDCIGDSLDTVDDCIHAVNAERRSYVH